ncbi:RING finger domain-containing protein [Histoplasma capsulatum var. duboisii H88]|uniref:RING finger domain-containing protein n=2 Tax=Ajellomyces capsulatus (strain H88) TaxID=544711 RepID=A0A8A1LRX7_AJEC8|nr:RING finger domain-containing protein [Histoplasma capsulatum var. duboisii H88]
MTLTTLLSTPRPCNHLTTNHSLYSSPSSLIFIMNGDPNIQLLAVRQARKRPHHEMIESHSHSRSTSPWDYAEPSGSNHGTRSFSTHRPTLPPLPQMRFPGDGYDFRRPIMASASAPTSSPPPPPHQENVIDLTDEPDNILSDRGLQTPLRQPAGRRSRPPRFGRNIMADVVDLDEESSTANEPHHFSSPEVQFLGTQIRPAEETRQNGIRHRNQDAPPHLRGSSLVDMIRRIRGSGPPSSYLQRQETIREEMGLRNRNLARALPTDIAPFWIGEQPIQGELEDDFPIELDYRTTGFGAGETRRTPAYVAPAAPPPGFTRTVGENEVVVCPNCDHELGTGDDAVRRQIWVAKPCGHVYCGQCTKYRARSRKRTDSASSPKTKPFAKCVVADCGKTISQPRAMFQIYL